MWKLHSKQRKQINKQLTRLSNYFEAIPLDTIDNILKESGLTLLQEDNTAWGGFICGREGRADFTVGVVATAEKQDGLTMYEPVENSLLILTWYKMQSGRYEIVTYMS
jgi:hypothetical protein